MHKNNNTRDLVSIVGADITCNLCTNAAYKMVKHEVHRYGHLGTISVDAEYEIPVPPAPKQPAAVSSGGGT